jgi:ubiquinone biosynthesis protein UbiJ
MLLEGPAFAFLNHVLAGEAWARARLKPFAGQHARFSFGPLAANFTVEGDGSLAAAASGVEPQVCIGLPDDAPLRLLTDRNGVLGAARISGAADFAEALGFVARNIRWDIESDLARLVGDIPARRMLLATGKFVEDKQRSARRLFENVAEYVVDEEGWVMRPAALSRFAAEARQMEVDLARLTERIARLA